MRTRRNQIPGKPSRNSLNPDNRTRRIRILHTRTHRNPNRHIPKRRNPSRRTRTRHILNRHIRTQRKQIRRSRIRRNRTTDRPMRRIRTSRIR
ncbi:MAG: hypothetical protein JSS49_29235 [Planctomycetes bacterium]|nr:hypothetical protein [Planctomycetota bacterium]